MLKFKINLQSAFNKSEVVKTTPDWIKINEYYRHTAIVIVSALKLLGEQKQNRKTVYQKKQKRISFTKKEKLVFFSI